MIMIVTTVALVFIRERFRHHRESRYLKRTRCRTMKRDDYLNANPSTAVCCVRFPSKANKDLCVQFTAERLRSNILFFSDTNDNKSNDADNKISCFTVSEPRCRKKNREDKRSLLFPSRQLLATVASHRHRSVNLRNESSHLHPFAACGMCLRSSLLATCTLHSTSTGCDI